MQKTKRHFQLLQAASLAVFFGLGIAAIPNADAQQADTAPALDDFSDLAVEAENEAPVAPQADAAPAPEQELSEEMQATLEEMDAVIRALDGDAERTGNSWQLSIEERTILVVTDTSQGRMRVISPIAPIELLPEGSLQRLMQANFDTALDARYAVAQNLVWAAFIHPLDTLSTRDFASGVLQTHRLGETFGTTFSSGALNYGGGDSGAIIDEQLQELLDQLEDRETT